MRRPPFGSRRFSALELIFGAVVALMVLKLVAQQSFGGTRASRFDEETQRVDDDADAKDDLAQTDDRPR